MTEANLLTQCRIEARRLLNTCDPKIRSKPRRRLLVSDVFVRLLPIRLTIFHVLPKRSTNGR